MSGFKSFEEGIVNPYIFLPSYVYMGTHTYTLTHTTQFCCILLKTACNKQTLVFYFFLNIFLVTLSYIGPCPSYYNNIGNKWHSRKITTFQPSVSFCSFPPTWPLSKCHILLVLIRQHCTYQWQLLS